MNYAGDTAGYAASMFLNAHREYVLEIEDQIARASSAGCFQCDISIPSEIGWKDVLRFLQSYGYKCEAHRPSCIDSSVTVSW